jgi:dethiobiotin synthetase
MRGVFVTGTGTEVGKTYGAAMVAHSFASEGQKVKVFKPVVTGLDDPGEPDHVILQPAARSEQALEEIAPFRYGPPVSPHLAAELAGAPLDPALLRGAFDARAAEAEAIVVEGVGGLLVPLTRDYLVRDLAADLALPLVVAASPGLGTINHTLLTLEAARAAGLRVAGVVLTPWPDAPSTMEDDNRATIGRLGEVEVATLPRLPRADPASLAAAGAGLPLDRWLG